MRSNVARHLRELGPTPAANAQTTAAVPAPALPDPRPAISAAEEDGYRRGRAEATAEAEAAIAALEARLAEAEALATRERAALAEAWTAQLQAGLESSFGALEARLAERISAVLKPVLTEQLVERACDAFAEAVRTLGCGTAGAALIVEGPQELLDRLQARLSASEFAAITLAATPRPDLRLELNGTVIETQLARMHAALEEALE